MEKHIFIFIVMEVNDIYMVLVQDLKNDGGSITVGLNNSVYDRVNKQSSQFRHTALFYLLIFATTTTSSS